MISATMLGVHAIAAVLFFLRGRKQGISEGVLGVATVLILFAVGWTLSTFVVNLVWPEQGVGVFIDEWQDTAFKRFLYREVQRDSASLTLLTAGLLPFYAKMLLRRGVAAEAPSRQDVA